MGEKEMIWKGEDIWGARGYFFQFFMSGIGAHLKKLK